MGLLRPQEVLEVFGRKSRSEAARVFIFGTKRIPIEVNNWWKFGVDISNHFWDIQFWTFLFFKVPSLWYKIVFENYVGTNRSKSLEKIKRRVLLFWFGVKWCPVHTNSKISQVREIWKWNPFHLCIIWQHSRYVRKCLLRSIY